VEEASSTRGTGLRSLWSIGCYEQAEQLCSVWISAESI